jgi:hypothetical protein
LLRGPAGGDKQEEENSEQDREQRTRQGSQQSVFLQQHRTHFSLHISTEAFLKPRSRFSPRDDRVVQAQDIHENCGQHQEQSQPDPPILVELSAARMFVTVVGHRVSLSTSSTI